MGIMKNADYVMSSNGLLEWEQLKTEETVTWGINANTNSSIRWDVDAATPCDSIDNCACFYFAIFQLKPEGVLSEAVRTCGQSSEGKLEGTNGRVVIIISVNTKVEANKVAISWEADGEAITEPPVTIPPAPTALGLFASTEAGLIALDLQTLEATALTSELTLAVAVNHNLGKVYWTESLHNSSIMRANLDGSAQEIIIPHTGNSIDMLAIDEASGNVWFALYYSQEITVCNAVGKNCAAVISNSSLIKYPMNIALNFEDGAMYWTKRGSSPMSICRASLDGSNATIISTGFSNIRGITLDQASNGVLYWADYIESTIGTVDVNSGNERTLVELDGDPGPWGIQVDAHKIYFSNNNSRNIQTVDKVSGEGLTTIFNSTGEIRQLALFNVPA